VISNIETCFLPPNTARSLSSALIIRFSLLSCRPFLRMYAQSFFTTSVRGRSLVPTTSASSLEGFSSFMKAALGLRLLAVFFAGFLVGFFAAILSESPPRLGTLAARPRRPPGVALVARSRGENTRHALFFIRERLRYVMVTEGGYLCAHW